MAESGKRTVTESEGRLTAADGTPLFCRWWRPESPRGVAVLVHGAGEHCGRFDHVARFLAGLGVAVCGYDQRGLGRSGGRRGHLERFDDYLRDLALVKETARAAYPGLPLGLYGHSMGGLVVLTDGLRNPATVDWVVASSPWLELAVQVPAWKAGLGRLLSRVWPSFSMPSGVPAIYLAHPAEVGEAYLKDPYVTTNVSARWYTELVAGAARTMAEAPAFSVPLLVLQAGDDRLVSPAAAEQFYGRAGTARAIGAIGAARAAGAAGGAGDARADEGSGGLDKTLRVYPGLYHEMHNEPEWAEVREDLARWLAPRLAADAAEN